MSARMPMCLIVAALLAGAALAQPEAGLIGRWDLQDGPGAMARDLSGRGHDGQIVGARWITLDGRPALSFDGSGDVVDCGDVAALKLAGDMTVSAWVKLAADPYPNPTTNWYLLNCEQYKRSGFCLRVDGSSGMLYYRASVPDGLTDFLSKARLPHGVYTHLVLVRKGDTGSLFLDGNLDSRTSLRPPAVGPAHFTLSDPSQSWQGLIGGVRLYDRALPPGEIVGLYKLGAAAHGKDTSGFGQFALRPYIYYAQRRALLEVKFKGILPLAPGDEVALELGPPGGAALQARPLPAIPDSAEGEYEFPLDQLADGAYEIRAVVRHGGAVKTSAGVPLHVPPLPAEVPAPTAKTVAALKPALGPIAYTAQLCPGGGLRVQFRGRTYALESSFSYPHGGENRLLAADTPDSKGEPGWQVTPRPSDAKTQRATARGAFYALEREVRSEPTRLLVRDTLRNTSSEDVGLIFAHAVPVPADKSARLHATPNDLPMAFLAGADHGLGLLALDDVFRVQIDKQVGDGRCGMGSNQFGLAPGQSYTFEWAIYPAGTGDFYDFVNTVRHDEGLDNRTMDGCYAITHSGRWLTETPPRDLIEQSGVKYVSSGCLTKITDDPGLSIEGFEFIEYPRMSETLRQTYIETKRLYPGLKVMFHIAPHLRVAKAGDERYADSRMLDAQGKHSLYDDGYFAADRRAQGWAFFPYYPTLDNSFGQAMLASVAPMMDGIGTDGVFADGLLSGYGAGGTYQGFTYDRWDGVSVEMDPATKLIRRKMGSVALLGREAVLAYVRKINARGGRVIINEMSLALRDFCKENTWFDAETNDGDHRCMQLYLSPTVIGLAQPNKSADERDVYDDIRAKLGYGALYAYYYWSCRYTHPVITSVMYPITPQEIRPGLVKGAERLITLNSGVYGWPGNRDLHQAYLADGRGVLVPPSFITTVDTAGVRTEISLQERETAVLRRIPITLQPTGPVNVVVEQYDAAGVRLACHGKGRMTVTLRDGDFRIEANASYKITIGGKTTSAKADPQGRLTFTITLDGPMRIAISR
jgi:hypothetical protein